MPISFDEHFERASKARNDRNFAEAHAAFEAALAATHIPHERALALNGLADCCFVNKQNERALDLMDQAIAACLPHPDAETPANDRIAHILATVWFDKGIVLRVSSRDEEALVVFNESLRRFLDRADVEIVRDDSTPNLRHVIVETLSMKGSTLHSLERLQEAFDCYEDLIRRFKEVKAIRVQKLVARAMCRRARLFGKLGRRDKEIAGYDELVGSFASSKNPDITETVLDALERKMGIYRDQEDLEMVIEICDDIVRRYEEDTHWRTADTVARTMIRQAVALGKRGEHGKEIANYDRVARQYGGSPEWMLRIHAAKALMFKAVTLNDADQGAAEMECYDEVLRRFAEDARPEVRAVAADALIYKGMSLGVIAEDAAEDTGVREIEAEIACYDEVVARYGEEKPIVLRRAVAEALLHKAETLLEAGRTADASASLELLLSRYAAIEDEEIQDTVKEARTLKAEI